MFASENIMIWPIFNNIFLKSRANKSLNRYGLREIPRFIYIITLIYRGIVR